MGVKMWRGRLSLQDENSGEMRQLGQMDFAKSTSRSNIMEGLLLEFWDPSFDTPVSRPVVDVMEVEIQSTHKE